MSSIDVSPGLEKVRDVVRALVPHVPARSARGGRRGWNIDAWLVGRVTGQQTGLHPRKPGLQLTLRWRKGDSNCRSRLEGEAVPTRHMATIRANLQDLRSRR